MLKTSFIFLLIILSSSCIPLQIAPNIEGAKIYTGKKFKKGLPKKQVYVFEDPKDANEFYYYINTKFETDYDIFGGNVPVSISGRQHFLSFYEIERKTKTVNLLPIAVDVAMESKGNSPLFEENHISRSGAWYIAITISDEKLRDNLDDEYPDREKIILFLDHVRKEYLSTSDYHDLQVYKK